MSLRRNTLANLAGQLFGAGLVLGLAPLYVDALGFEAWGLVGLVAVFSAWFNLLDVGLSPSLSRQVARAAVDPAERAEAARLLRAVEWVYGLIAVLVVGTLLLAAGPIAQHWLQLKTLDAGEARSALGWIGLAVALRLAENGYRAVLAGQERMVLLNALSSLAALLRWGLGLVLLLRLGWGIDQLFAWQAAMAGLSLLAFAVLARRALPGPGGQGLSALGRVRGFATGLALSSFFGFLLTQVDKVLLSRLLPLEDFGRYALVVSLSDALAMLAAPLYAALLPRFVALHAQGDEAGLARLYLLASQGLAAVLMPCALLLVLHGEAVLTVWTGSAELGRQMAPLLALLALGRMINAMLQLPAALQVAAGWSALGAQVNLVAVLLIVPMILVAVPAHGVMAYGVCWLLLNLGYLAFGTWRMHQRLLVAWRGAWLRQALLQPLAWSLPGLGLAGLLAPADLGRTGLGLLLLAGWLGSLALTALGLPGPRGLLRSRMTRRLA